MKTYVESLNTPIVGEVDVIVAGGGSAGFAAALNAARNGAKTLLIEKEYMIGGIMTAGLMAKIAAEPFMTGIPTEFIMRLGKEKMAIPYEEFPAPWPPSEMVEIPVDSEACKLLAEDMLCDAAAEILYGTSVVGVVKEGNTVQGVIVENKSGRSVIPAKVFIDATGDGDLCARAGAQFEFGKNGDGKCSASNMLSRIAGVDWVKVIDYLDANPKELSKRIRRGQTSDWLTPKILREYVLTDRPQFVGVGRFEETVEKIKADPNVSDWEKNVLQLRGGIGFMNTPILDQVLVNTGRVGLNGLDAMEISRAIIECRRQNWCMFRFMKKYIPGFENSYLIETSSILGIRETRRIVCDYFHTIEDFHKRVRFDDAILRSDDSVEFHNPDGAGTYFELYTKGEYEEISYRSILVKGLENVMAIGRCWSADQMTLSANRNIGFCMSMGQAAGMAAAMAVKGGAPLRGIDTKALQRSVYPLKEK
jgi:hypothetical protein